MVDLRAPGAERAAPHGVIRGPDGAAWVTEGGQNAIGRVDPRDHRLQVWKRPGERPRAYSVWVDPSDKVWLTDFRANAIVRFDPATESFLSSPSDKPGANVRQMDGVAGAAWCGASGTDRIVRIEYGL